MDVIRHDDITAKGNALCLGLGCEAHEFTVHRFIVQDGFAVEGGESNEVDRGIVGLKDVFKATGLAGLAFHA